MLITRAWRGEIGDGSSDSRYVLVRKLRLAGFGDEDIAAIVCSRRWFNRYQKRARPPADVRRDVERLLAKGQPQPTGVEENMQGCISSPLPHVGDTAP